MAVLLGAGVLLMYSDLGLLISAAIAVAIFIIGVMGTTDRNGKSRGL
jgi:hypothetical protein